MIENDKGTPNVDEDRFLLYRTGGWSRSEDCLRVNVFTPAEPGNNGRKRAVMVYMHGGGFSGGSGNDLLSYDGENLARRHGVVVVTHNHRLNLFGYLNLAELGGERYAASGNVGMLDIVAVLEWVRDNINQFGGDPANVLVFGQSGGGAKVSALMAMPAAKGLFHRAAIQSGAMLRASATDNAPKVRRDGGRRARNFDEPVGQAPRATDEHAAGGAGWGPVVDGKILPAHPFDPAPPEISAHVPMLIGTCLNEIVNGTDNPERDTLTEEILSRRVSEKYKNKAGDIIAAYRKQYPNESSFGLWAAISAAAPRRNSITQAERQAARASAPVYMYLYAWRTPALGGNIGTFHSSEIPFVFDNASLCTNYSGGSSEALALSSKMCEAWASFARTGKPSHGGLPAWPAYDAKSRATMIFNTPCAIQNDPEGAGLRLIESSA